MTDTAKQTPATKRPILRDERGRIIGGAETFRDLGLVEQLRQELEGRFQVGDLVSRSAAMRRIFDLLPQIAPSDATVLIYGETGPAGDTIAAQTRAAESRAIRAALEHCGFNRLAAAQALGLHKSTLFRKVKALGIAFPDRDGRSGRCRPKRQGQGVA